ncbi:MAG: glycoside hydrolase family 2 TIM barrel-domain containing protein [Bacteroidales bacterium]
MKVTHWIVLGLILIFATWLVYRTRDAEPRSDHSIDLNWRFTLGDPVGASAPDYDDTQWRYVTVPHDWMIEQPVNISNPSGSAGGFYPGGIGWYRNNLDLSSYQEHEHFYLLFEGVYRNADIYFNGTHLGSHAYGYSSFYYDISELVRRDTLNSIAVRTDCSKMPGDPWYSGAGIFRPVRLIATHSLHIPPGGNWVSSTLDNTGEALLNVSMEIRNDGRKARRFDLHYDIVDPDGGLVAESQATHVVGSGRLDTIVQPFRIENPLLWSPESPRLYVVNCYLMDGNRQIDHLQTIHGIRSSRFDPGSGFTLNGEKMMVKGVTLHHDGGELGAAVPLESWRRRLLILKELGVNAISLAHPAHAPDMLDLCDEMGFMVIGERAENGQPDPAALVRRDRNHPSVIPGSVGTDFICSGIDFLGESAGWPDRGCRNGLLQTNGFIKPNAWYIASNYREDPMVKLTVMEPLPADSLISPGSWPENWMEAPLVDHWNFSPESVSGKVVVFTNCKRIELRLNHKLFASLERSAFSDGVIRSTIPCEPGELVATAFFLDENGRERQISDTLITAGEPYALAMQPDRKQVSANKREVVHITTSVVDSSGTLNPFSNHLVNYTLDGPGRIRVIDNGDLADHTPPGSASREVRRGKQLLVLQAGGEPGDLIINASSEGLKPSRVRINSTE